MKKLVVAIIAALAIATLLAAGCGGSKSSSSPTAGSAQAILKANQAKMQGVKSFKINGTYTVTTPAAEVKTESASVTGEVQMESANDVRAHVTATPAGGGKPSEIYVVDGYQYSYNPNKGWSKSAVGSSSDLQASGIVTPSSISDLTKFAENMKLGPVQNGKYVLTFDYRHLGSVDAAACPGHEGTPERADHVDDLQDRQDQRAGRQRLHQGVAEGLGAW
jgi:outer membrane lipoprotein-sorting protein